MDGARVESRLRRHRVRKCGEVVSRVDDLSNCAREETPNHLRSDACSQAFQLGRVQLVTGLREAKDIEQRLQALTDQFGKRIADGIRLSSDSRLNHVLMRDAARHKASHRRRESRQLAAFEPLPPHLKVDVARAKPPSKALGV